ncbi:toll-like receptor 6 [Aphidius gifuensis]|uniref:toll-like receptor 6 n=1 Tax=Aphidius gifuensis TaxID=684658 RepID=UPI001CDB9F60|nr:toll-like receptor 6 [Aphidius gifuensis]
MKEIQVTSDIGSNTIENYVFSDEFPSLTILKLDLPVKNISIEPYAFANLTNLENIEINSAIVLLNVDTFKDMPKLKSLKLQIINSTTANLIAVLKNHPSLTNLELLNHYTVDICNYQNDNNPLQLLKLQYTGGHLKALSNRCFKCLKYLTELIITKIMPIVPDTWQPNILEIQDNEISSIEENTFVNITITTLIIASTAKNFKITEKSFEGLSKLEYLELKTQRIKLNSHFLDHLKSLVTLEISATDSERCNCKYTCELVRRSNLKNLLISDAEKIAICKRDICIDRNTKILSLRYTHGWFTMLQHSDFFCLKKLEYLGVTNSSLIDIKPGSFVGLDKLTTLVLSSNKLTQIDQNTFENLTNLNSLILCDNKIDNIVNGAFRGKILSMLDLSYNKLTSISKNLFVDVIIRQLDLSNNKLITIEIGAFKTLSFETLNVDNNDELEGNLGIWSADETRIQAKCFTQAFFKICTKLNSLSSVNVVVDKFIVITFLPDFLLPSRKLELFDISSINRNAFKYSNVRSHFRTLTIHYTGGFEFMIFPESFEGLINLENLILNVGAIKLKKNLFVELKSLKYLKIGVIETSLYLSQILTDLKNLKTLQIVGNHSVGICQNSFSKEIPNSIIDIRYTTGTIDRLQENSLICVQQIEVFTITKTQLSTIEVGAFNLLNNLRYINLSFNKISLVSMNVFNNLKSLAVLLLNNNEIEDIDDEAFMLFDNKNFVLYNLSHNELTTIEENTFDSIKSDQLDLSYNKIRSIEAGAFTDSNIKDLYLFSNIDIYEVKTSWNVSASTNVHIKTSVFFDMYCLSNRKTESVISCEACPSMCIPLKYFSPRLG